MELNLPGYLSKAFYILKTGDGAAGKIMVSIESEKLIDIDNFL